MIKGYFKRGLVLGIIFLFLGASIIPVIGADIIKFDNENIKGIYDNRKDGEILFEDDFNDNSINLSKWEQIYFDGNWYEQNGRAGLKIKGRIPTPNEGIQNTNLVNYKIGTNSHVVITCTLITNVESNGIYGGVTSIRVMDYLSEKKISIEYRRTSGEFHILDTSGGDLILFNKSASQEPWDIRFDIFSDHYNLSVKGVGWFSDNVRINNSIFIGDTSFKLRLVVDYNEENENLYYIAGFDDVMIQGFPTSLYNRPDTPQKPVGNDKVKSNIEYTFTDIAFDPDGDPVLYKWKWGDGSESEWIGPYNQGILCGAKHSFKHPTRTYIIQVRAKDIYDLLSDWSDPLEVKVMMPRDRILYNDAFIMYLEHFPVLQKLLNRLGQ